MIVHKADGTCRTCGGVLVIVDADEATMTVACQENACGDCYLIEPDALRNGYHAGMIAQLLAGGGDT